MSYPEYLSNYYNDLLCSQKTPLLIELTAKEIQKLHNFQSEDAKYFPLSLAERIYNQEDSTKGSNIFIIDGDNVASGERFLLLEILLEKLRDDVKGIKSLATLKESLKMAASMASGGLINDFFGSYLDKGLNFLFNEASEQFSSLLTDVVVDQLDLSKTILSGVEGVLSDSAGIKLGDIVNKISLQQLHLSASAKSELAALSSTFSKSLSIDAFQLAFKLLLAIALDAPKLIYINNPHKLDNSSIGLLSLLFSFAKNQKDHDKHIGLSVIYTYTDEAFSLYGEVDEVLHPKQQLLVEQRRFAQRYAMLEKPSSDIPMVAVKSSLFVGRRDELEQLNRHFTDRQPTTLSVISGEPGIGKTALVNQHLNNIQAHDDIIALTLVNEVGHSSSNTGLSSLEKSIIDEAKRIELLVGLKDKGVNFLKSMASKDNAYKAIGVIFSGADKALAVADTGFQRINVDKHIQHVQQIGIGDIDNKQGDAKQQQFDKLDKALIKLKNISSNNLPIVLFIDDLQWIDDTSSEYILTRLLQQPDLYIVATLRPSDGATVFKKHLTHQSLHTYSLKLLKACQVKGYEAYSEEVESELRPAIIPLAGFDKSVLEALISQVIKGEPSQHAALTNSIFTALSGNEATEVNTLFAVETINMLCDKKLYGENTFERLILDAPLRFNPELKNIESTLTETFSTLQAKYKDSLAHVNELASGQRFNLMAYAVLEERLHLLKIHFTTHGNAAVNTLLFSSLLGAPFSSDIVKKSLEAIAHNNNVLLAPLRAHINQSDQEIGLTAEHYVIIDEVYEILSRFALTGDKYTYRHGLLNIFLEKQVEYLLDTVFIEENQQAKEALFKLILSVIAHEHKQQPFYGKPDLNLNYACFEQLIFFKMTEQKLLSICYQINPKQWAISYAVNLRILASCYYASNQITESIRLNKKSIAICKQFYAYDKKSWAKNYTIGLNNLALCYGKNNQLAHAIPPLKESLSIRKELYEDNEFLWSSHYALSLNNLAYIYCENNQFSEATVLLEDALNVYKGSYKNNEVIWAQSYSRCLINLGVCYEKSHQLTKAITFKEEALNIQKKLYVENKTSFAKSYTINLISLTLSYNTNKQYNQAILLAEEALAIVKVLYQKNTENWTENWAETYSHVLINLAQSYFCVGKLQQAIKLEEEAISIIKPLYLDNNAVWSKEYTTILSGIADSYESNNQLDLAIMYRKESVDILRLLYQNNKMAWVEDYVMSLNCLALAYKKNKHLLEAFDLISEALCINKALYQEDTKSWAETYMATLSNLSLIYYDDQKIESAIELQKEALDICTNLYKENNNAWYENYIQHLSHLSLFYYNSNKLPQCAELQGKLLPIYRQLYQKGLTIWTENYIQSLDLLSKIHSDNNKLLQSIKLKEETLDIYRKLYLLEQDVWTEDYIICLRSLVSIYKENNKLPQAVTLQIEEVSTLKLLYNGNNTAWAEIYTDSLDNLVVSYYKNNQLPQAIALQIEALTILEVLYNDNNTTWAKKYIKALNYLALFHKKDNKIPQAIVIESKVLTILKPLYQDHSAAWAEDYTIILNNLANSYREDNQVAQAIVFGRKALTILKQLYESDKVFWRNDYITSLIHLAPSYERNNELPQAIMLQVEVLKLIKPLYQADSTEYAEIYIHNLKNLAISYFNNNQISQSIMLEEEALGIIALHYQENNAAWIETYAKNLRKLAESYSDNNQLTAAIELSEKELTITAELYKANHVSGLQGYLNTLNTIATYQLRLEQYQAAHEHLSQYFKLFILDSIEEVEQCAEFIYPFVKYAQASNHSSQPIPFDFDKAANEFNTIMLQKFASQYKKQIDILLHGNEDFSAYIELSKSNKPLDSEKYQLFVQYFAEPNQGE
ncbi:ATP-binding protein [Pseudoalteromonas sp. SWN29]|uniref:tetratricopeptide repeat protein n=1 Tax=Pseudoalteromonas sp. SWN29 TaxID=2792064 RepID=UPI0018CCBA22|nr:tetratricopeptide repeat protein [Pseudoalteromonas sp. SWN29]MBH0027544.1 ATP-binding protein [Pseudoalteromonas sp. SWN29]